MDERNELKGLKDQSHFTLEAFSRLAALSGTAFDGPLPMADAPPLAGERRWYRRTVLKHLQSQRRTRPIGPLTTR